MPALEKLVADGQEHIVDVALMVVCTGADRADLLERFSDASIDGETLALFTRRNFGAAGLRDREPRLTFKGLCTTTAMLDADGTAKRSLPTASEAYARVQAMLGHHSASMSHHYASRAEVEVSNRGSVEMLRTIRRKTD